MLLNNYGSGGHECPHCRHGGSRRNGKGMDGATYSLLAGQEQHEDDVEANAGAGAGYTAIADETVPAK